MIKKELDEKEEDWEEVKAWVRKNGEGMWVIMKARRLTPGLKDAN